jgi:hypothetical protein
MVDCSTGRKTRNSLKTKSKRQIRLKKGKMIVVRTQDIKAKLLQYFQPGGAKEQDILMVV